VFDISGSMQFDTACFGCYDIFRDGNRPWYNLDQPSPTGDPAFSNIFPNPAYINPIPVRHLPDKSLYHGSGTVWLYRQHSALL
jgi:hypothetical protein